MEREMYDKVGFLLFTYIFNENILKQIPSRAILFEQVMLRHRFKDYLNQEIILNIAFFCFHWHKNENWEKKLPTVIMTLLDEDEKLDLDLLNQEFLIKWKNGDNQVLDFFKKHCLYNEEYDNNLKIACKPVFEYLEEDEDNEDESDEEEESEDDN
jgi:hypothetical protein